ncbi:MAG TPA: LLM class flavin-dependent oxidoreductase [Actinomycetota bacterium]|nr:LLM class flavin-dependent oxidoreductase [Actinomycetota bacterium]
MQGTAPTGEAGGAGAVTPPPDPTTVKVGVLLARGPAELGEWLADAAAFEAAGAHALWVDPEPESELDPLALLAALAAITSRALLVATPASEDPSEALGRTLATIGRLSHGRLALAAGPGRLEELTALAPGSAAFRRLPGEPATFERQDEAETAERWVLTPPPEGRAAWRTALADAVTNGAGGLLVPAGPRLLDILRNPNDPEDRRDLHLAQG